MSKWDKLHVESADRPEVGAIVFRLSGVLDSSPESYSFLEAVQEDAHTGSVRLVINLSNVTIMTSAGVGILAACFTSVTNAGGKMCLAGATGRAAIILNVVRMLDVVSSAATEDEAVRMVCA